MTFGHQKLPASDHPFLRHATSPDWNKALGSAIGEGQPMAEMLGDGDVMQTLSGATETWDQFIAMALNFDPPAATPPSQSLDNLMMDFISRAKHNHGAIGGYCKNSLYLCALPGMGLPDAVQMADDFVNQLATRRPETVSIGIAPFPLLAYDKRHAWSNACKALDHGAFLGPGSVIAVDAVSLNISGDRHYHLDEMDYAVAEYSAALELDPNNTNARNSLGVCFAELDDGAAAEAEFKIVTEIDPDEPMAWYNLGMLSRLNGRNEAALAYFKRAYTIQCDFFEIPFQIGRILSEQCRWTEALEYAEKAAELHQGHWSVHSLMGICLATLDRIPEAIRAYTQSVKRNPNNPWDLSALGCLFDARNENPDICRALLEQSIALSPDNGLFHNRLGQWYEKHRQYEEALAAYQQASAWGHDSSNQMASIQKLLPKDSDPAMGPTG
jgi:Flp pilus assembly protein TadD